MFLYSTETLGCSTHTPVLRRYAAEMTTWVILAGLPATGKSTLARALAERIPAAILDKDGIRSAIFGTNFTDYSEEQDDLCMHTMIEAARYLTARARTDFILFDGRTFSRTRQIEEVVRAAEGTRAEWRILHLHCSPTVAEERLAKSQAEHPAANRGVALYREIERRFEPVLHPELQIDTTSGLEGQLDAVIDFLSPGLPPRHETPARDQRVKGRPD